MATIVSVELKRVTHANCGATIEYNIAECREEYRKDYDGSGDMYRVLRGPNCGKDIWMFK